MHLHPIPPGLWCVPSALVALTGAPFDAVIHPALNRHARADTLHGLVTGSTIAAALATLRELGYRPRRYTKSDLRAQVRTWAERSTRYPGRSLFLGVAGHVLVVRDGVVYDTHAPHGAPGATHPYARALVTTCYLVDPPVSTEGGY